MISRVLNERDVERAGELIRRSRRVALMCHLRPDGDALGSTLALFSLLKKLGKEVRVVTPDVPPRHFSFMPGIKSVVAASKYQDFAERLLRDADLLICCDFNKLSRLGEMREMVERSSAPVILIDHHLDPDDFATVTFSRPEMSSASELTFRLIAALGLFDEVDMDCAFSLATGIITDTRNFTVNCDNPEIFLIMFELSRMGVDRKRILREALELKSEDSFRLTAYAVSEKMRLYKEHSAAIITLDRAELQRFHYEKGDTEGLVNRPLEIRGVTYSFFLREDEDCIKVSGRSVGDFPVNKICEELFDGGGHRQAAGGEYRGSLTECVKLLESALPRYDKYLKHGNNEKK